MKVAIVGSRNYSKLDEVRRYVRELPADTEVISGGARGVDSVAEHEATARKLKVTVFRADWAKHGKQAGFMRNHDIILAADKVVAFWDGQSRGTAHDISLARSYQKPLEVIR